MDLLRDTILAELAANGRESRESRDRELAGFEPIDHRPVVKLFKPDDPDVTFGLCDPCVDFPEIGSVRLSDIRALRGRLGLPVERDLHFEPDVTRDTRHLCRARPTGGRDRRMSTNITPATSAPSKR